VKILGKYSLDETTPPSDVFRFIGESVELEYLRKS